MRRLSLIHHSAFLILTLTLLASCGPQPASPTPAPTITQSPNPPITQSPNHSITPTPTEIPQPALAEIGISSEVQKTLETQQGWLFKWDAARGAYIITQRAWDAEQAQFNSSTLGEVGYIDTEGRLHLHSASFTAVPGGEKSAFQASAKHGEIALDLKSLPPVQTTEATSIPENNAKERQLGPFTLVETQNPLFAKTGILKFTDENGNTWVYSAASALPSERDINGKKVQVVEFIQMPEISQDINQPTYIPWELLHQGALHALYLIVQGYDQPFYAYDELSEADKTLATYPQGEKFEGWRIQFQYDDKTQSKIAFLRPTNGHSQRWAMKDGKVPFFITFAPDSQGRYTPHKFTAVLIHNPQDPAHPLPDETMLLGTSMGEWWSDPDLRDMFAKIYLSETDPTNPHRPNPNYFSTHLAPRIFLASENGYLGKTPWGAFPGRPSLDQLLEMEGNDVRSIDYYDDKTGQWYAYFPIELETFFPVLKDKITVQETNSFQVPLTPTLQKVVLGVGP